MNESVFNLIELYVKEKQGFLDQFPVKDVERAIDSVWRAYEDQKCIYAFGNGGNAAYVSNMVTDLFLHPFVSEDKGKPVLEDIPRLKILNLSESPSTITALVNDVGPDYIFSHQLINHGVDAGDLVIGFSGSGNSKNIITAFEAAKKRGATTIGVARDPGGKMKGVTDILILIPGVSTFPGQTGNNNFNFHFEDALSSISHIITGIFKMKIMEKSNG